MTKKMIKYNLLRVSNKRLKGSLQLNSIRLLFRREKRFDDPRLPLQLISYPYFEVIIEYPLVIRFLARNQSSNPDRLSTKTSIDNVDPSSG